MSTTPSILPVKKFFEQGNVKQKFEEMLGQRAPQFITSVLQIVSQNEMLRDADPISVYNAAAVAATLNLPLNQSLGQAYIVPYNNRQPDGSTKKVAQFQIGYKGFIQLAQRSGQYKYINSSPIREGQVKGNALTGYEFDIDETSQASIVGYAAYFQLLNGFEKTLYMPIEKVREHGKKYSKSFSNKYGLWNTDFDTMAEKTVLKLLLSKFGPLSIEMERAIIADQSEVKDFETMDVEYVDNDEVVIDKELDRIRGFIDKCSSIKELENIYANVPVELKDYYQAKLQEVK